MRKILCDICGKRIHDTENVYRVKIFVGSCIERDILDVCRVCYSKIVNTIDNIKTKDMDA